MPSACCTTPVTSDGNLFFAGWSPGDPAEKDFKMPEFDAILKEGDTDKDGILSKEESLKTEHQGLLRHQDANKDGKLTREEWDTLLKFCRGIQKQRVCAEAGRHRRCDEQRRALETNEGSAVRVVRHRLPRPVSSW